MYALSANVTKVRVNRTCSALRRRLSNTVREAMGKLRSMLSNAARLMTRTRVTVNERIASSCDDVGHVKWIFS